jgi:hypothetical protein
MKKILVIIAIMGSSFFANAVPVNEKVLSAFQTTFVDATDAVWTENENTFEVSFTHFGVPTKVEYDVKGNILSAERESTVALLPMKVVKELVAKYPDMKINKVTEVNKKKKLYYVIKLESAGELHTVRFDAAGNMKRISKCEL